MKKRSSDRRDKDHFALGSVMSKDARSKERRGPVKNLRKSLDLCDMEVSLKGFTILHCRRHKDHGPACQSVIKMPDGTRVIVSWYKTK